MPLQLTPEQCQKIADALGLAADATPDDVTNECLGTLSAQHQAVEDAGTRITALSATVDTLTAERDQAQAVAVEAERTASTAQATLAASATAQPRQADPTMVSMVNESADTYREMAVRDGTLHASTVKAIDTILFEGGNDEAVFALSATPNTGKKPRQLAFWKAIASAPKGVPLGQQSAAVSLATGIPATNPDPNAKSGEPLPFKDMADRHNGVARK